MENPQSIYYLSSSDDDGNMEIDEFLVFHHFLSMFCNIFIWLHQIFYDKLKLSNRKLFCCRRCCILWTHILYYMI